MQEAEKKEREAVLEEGEEKVRAEERQAAEPKKKAGAENAGPKAVLKEPNEKEKSGEAEKEKAGGKKENPEKKEKRKKENVIIEKPKKPLAVLEKRDAVRKKKSKPVFRGRFGKKSIRKVSGKKWSRWRKPRGIDICRYKEDGRIPTPGFGTDRNIRHIHPSGYSETPVFRPEDLEGIGENEAVRIGGKVGRKKRAEIAKKAGEKKIRLLNY